MALGGVRDEAEIRAIEEHIWFNAREDTHGMKKAEKITIISLDEIDKLGADWRGDPSSALLEVLDPAKIIHFRTNTLRLI